MEHMEHKAWLDSIIGTDSYRTACEKIGASPSTISQQLKRGGLSPEITVALARAYDVSPVDALVTIGLLKPEDVSIVGVEIALSHAKNSQLLAEFDRRVDPDFVRETRGEGAEITPHFDEMTSNVRKRPRVVRDDSYDDGTVQEWDDAIPHAADSSKNENEERIRRGEDIID